MGKASELATDLGTRPLSAAEIAARQAAVASGGEIQATIDGRLMKADDLRVAPREVLRAPTQTWD
jgi:hypothetical protein